MQYLLYTILLIITTCFNTAICQPFGRFASFDGVDDKYSLISSVVPNNSDFTIEFWMKTCINSVPSPAYSILSNGTELLVSVFDASSSLRMHMLCLDDANIAFVCHQDHQYPSKDSQWHHIAVTYDRTADHFEMYFDGIDGTLSPSSTYNFSPGFRFEIGDDAWSQWFYNQFRGYFDELRVSNIIRYSGAFPISQVSQGPFSMDAFTVGLWHFEESNPVSLAMDESNNNYDLVASGNLQTIAVDTVQIQGTSTLSAPTTFNNYQWIDCLNGDNPIAGATSPSYAPTANGVYAVVVSDYICPIKSNCINITNLDIQRAESEANIAIYPNPTSGIVHIELGNNKEFRVELFDLTGKHLLSQKSSVPLQLNLKDYNTGMFLIRVCTAEESITEKIVCGTH